MNNREHLMTDFDTQQTALVTGANSGLGLEAAAQLAEQGYDRVITARTEDKAEGARQQLLSLWKPGTSRPTKLASPRRNSSRWLGLPGSRGDPSKAFFTQLIHRLYS